ncbi:hypothetical protein ASE93_03100 [Serratia sp. Leaf50]|nr:hypothetical protein ASE93_03100 [Serratia sp. Leaf50]
MLPLAAMPACLITGGKLIFMHNQAQWNKWLLTLGDRDDWATTQSKNRLPQPFGFKPTKGHKKAVASLRSHGFLFY